MFATAIIVFREVLEAALIVGIVAAATRTIPGRNRWLAAGIAAGLAGSALVALGTDRIADMGTRDERVDAYIGRAPDFARPILAHLRTLVHAACPGVSETIKWGFPHFEFNGILCSMAAFKTHCAFGFWHGAMLPVAVPLLPESVDDGRPCVTSLPPARSERSVCATRAASAFLR